MELIILNDGLYQLIPVTKQMLEGVELVGDVDCFELCEILRLKLTGYIDTLNLHIMNDGTGNFMGCMCRQTNSFAEPITGLYFVLPSDLKACKNDALG